MSVPRIDPKFTLKDLSHVGEKFLDAGNDYWAAAHKAGIGGAIMWLTSESGAMVIYTRGEYKDSLLANIERQGPTTSFGAMTDGETGEPAAERVLNDKQPW
jgi:hypothetical protein